MGRPRATAAWLGLGLVAAAFVVMVAILLPTIVVRLQPPELREPGEWRFTHRLEPVAGMTVIRRILTRDQELTIVRSDDDVAQCTVDLTPGRANPARDDRSEKSVWINGWRGRSVDGRSQDPYVTWEYAPRARATVTCTRPEIPPATLLAVARAVRFRGADRIRLPFTFAELPRGYRVYSLEEDTSSETAVLSVGLQPVDRASIPSVVVSYGSDDVADSCLGEAREVCLTTRWSAEEAPGAQQIVRQSLARVAEQIELAADPSDPTTWFDGADLPR